MVASRTSRYAAAAVAALVIAALVIAAGAASANCVCRCVDGSMQAVCTGPESPIVCPPAVCPIPPPSIAPIVPPRLPPPGTETCTQQQVLDPRTGRYEWQEVCR